MADILTNVEISKVYEGKSGESEYGPWTAYNFYVKGYDHKFGYFQKDGGLAPAKGMKILMLEYEIKQRGEYTNYDVKRIELLKDISTDTLNPPQTAPGPHGKTQRDSNVTMFISYAKDLMVALLPYHAGYNQMELEDLANIVTQTGMNMQDKTSSSKPEPNTDPIEMPNTPDNTEEPQYHGPDDTPIGDPPPI